MSCAPRLERATPSGYLLLGACGERVHLAALPLRLEDLPPTACDAFRAAALERFGRRGDRSDVDVLEHGSMPDDLRIGLAEGLDFAIERF